jgi:hypothetical protein
MAGDTLTDDWGFHGIQNKIQDFRNAFNFAIGLNKRLDPKTEPPLFLAPEYTFCTKRLVPGYITTPGGKMITKGEKQLVKDALVQQSVLEPSWLIAPRTVTWKKLMLKIGQSMGARIDKAIGRANLFDFLAGMGQRNDLAPEKKHTIRNFTQNAEKREALDYRLGDSDSFIPGNDMTLSKKIEVLRRVPAEFDLQTGTTKRDVTKLAGYYARQAPTYFAKNTCYIAHNCAIRHKQNYRTFGVFGDHDCIFLAGSVAEAKYLWQHEYTTTRLQFAICNITFYTTY